MLVACQVWSKPGATAGMLASRSLVTPHESAQARAYDAALVRFFPSPRVTREKTGKSSHPALPGAPITGEHRVSCGAQRTEVFMGHEAIALWTEASSDPELIAGVRAGDTAAFGVLYERHVDAARKVASMYSNSPTDVEDVVSEDCSRVLRALQRGDGPDLAFRAYLFTIVRRTGMDIINKAIRTKPRDDMSPYESTIGYEASSDEPTLDGFEHGMVAEAFKSLPERWQAVLWYTEVEKKSPKEIAPLLGLSANGVAALAYRAREALRQAYLQQHLNTSQSADCLEANTQLGAYVRGGLAKREHTKVDAHVQACAACAALVTELEDVNRGMRGIIAPLTMGVLGAGALEGGLPIGGALGAQGVVAAGATGAGGAAVGGG